MTDDERKARAAGDYTDQAVESLMVDLRRPRERTEMADPVLQDVPSEYHSATASDFIMERLRFARAHQSKTLTMIGPAGTGKTWQLWGIYKRVASNLLKQIERNSYEFRMQSVLIISEAVDMERNRYDHAWVDKAIAHHGILAVDDIGYGKTAHDWCMQAVYTIANERRKYQRLTIWTTNLSPERLSEYYSPAIASRLLGGVVIELDGVDKRA